MIKVLAPSGVGEALAYAIGVPRLDWCFQEGDLCSNDDIGKVGAERAVVIAYEILRSVTKWCDLTQLLRYPSLCRRIGDTHLHDSP